MQKRKWFTLLEIMISIIGFSLLMVVVFWIFQKFIILKYNAQARGTLIEWSYFTLEKVNLLLKDYTIDYEEYFNRKQIWCNSPGENSFTWDVWLRGYCENFTAYGNQNAISDPAKFNLYYCSSVTWETTPRPVFEDAGVTDGDGCATWGHQSFGEYAQQFRDAKDNVDFTPWVVGDDDDFNVGKWPHAIADATGVQELYLISQDKTRRIMLRRALIETGNFETGGMNIDTNKLYTIQMLKLRGFDAGNNHLFDVTQSSGVYDGIIDTRACDYAQWFVCGGSSLSGAYSDFRLPADQDDGWVNLFDRELTISDRNIKVFPTKNPELAWDENEVQINPYFTLSLTSKLYGWVWFHKLHMPSIDDFQLSLQTTFNTKNFYTK